MCFSLQSVYSGALRATGAVISLMASGRRWIQMPSGFQHAHVRTSICSFAELKPKYELARAAATPASLCTRDSRGEIALARAVIFKARGA